MLFSKHIIILLSYVLCLVSISLGQNKDCSNLLKVTEAIVNSPEISGFGAVKEFEGNELENLKLFEEEANSIWYLITIPVDGVFTFDILPLTKGDDWDFLLFEHKSMFCKRIEDNKIEPIRTNMSRSDKTGLNKESNESYVGAGVNLNYSKALDVKKGEEYVLVVNNSKKAGGKHQLVLNYPKVEKVLEIVKAKEIDPPQLETILFKISVKDAATKELILSDVIISGLRTKTIELDTITSFQTSISKSNYELYIMAHAKGYMLASKEVKITQDKEVFYTEILLSEIVVGTKVSLKNIQFYGNRYDFLPSASDDLKALLSFMKKNPTVIIEIEGHVNGPNEKNTNAYKELSNNRAKTVKEYLLKNDIKEDRIKYVGYGNSQMLFPNPKSEREHSENRRVEIKILAK